MRLLSVAFGVVAAAVLTAAPANADPDVPPPPPPGPPGVAPAAPPPGLTREQQCAWIAFRTWVPCNWIMPNPPPPGTPGTM
ncbi:hypothetical protein MSAS_31790 [Mycobacterium saskatchewanense]|uniref:hypothetical protein n=1 Tax=Mycobacterium saskatchewanense TaxID=220927 RepID=UPI00114F87AE|nr:hypothetical protein [Mycobacterium saskatchewanense]BBX64005.1 hypothetical protein MSAS_31790 [Mycobacterium saskatchewanense]